MNRFEEGQIGSYGAEHKTPDPSQCPRKNALSYKITREIDAGSLVGPTARTCLAYANYKRM